MPLEQIVISENGNGKLVVVENNDHDDVDHQSNYSATLAQIKLNNLKSDLLRVGADLNSLATLGAAVHCPGGQCSLLDHQDKLLYDNKDHDHSHTQLASDLSASTSSSSSFCDDEFRSLTPTTSSLSTSNSSLSLGSLNFVKLDNQRQQSEMSAPHKPALEGVEDLTINHDNNNNNNNNYNHNLNLNQTQLQSIDDNCWPLNGDPATGQQQAAMPRRSRSLVNDARLDTQRNRQLLDEIRTEAETTRAKYKQLTRLDSIKPAGPAAAAAGVSLVSTGSGNNNSNNSHTIDEAGEECGAEEPGTVSINGFSEQKVQQQEHEQQQEQQQEHADELLLLQDEAKEIERSLIDFPRHIGDLDHCNHLLIKYEPELDPTHPGYHDLEYRARRKEVAEVAFAYKFGDKIPCIQYNDKELATWKIIYLRLKEAYAKYACKQHNCAIEQLEAEHVYSPNYIPQLQAVSEFLEKKTGWRLRPVAGLLSARDFLSSLAFRVFQTTQYIRHWGNPEHSVEPDCIHELMGHIPMLCDPEFAQFSQELGLASLGASDEQIERFATIYWFTVEFGLCKEELGQLKCYGAGLLSSYGEMEHALESGKPALREFVPEETALEVYDDSEYQVVYYVATSFEEAKAKIKAYAANHLRGRQFELAYDPYSCTIRELNSYDQLEVFANSIKCDINRLSSAISKLKLSSSAPSSSSSSSPPPPYLQA